MHICEPVIAPLIFVGESRVVNPQQMQYRGVEVVHVNRVLNNIVTVVLWRTVDVPCLNPRTGKQRCETIGVMIAPGILAVCLSVDGAAKFPAPDNERILQQASTFQIK